jgi:hypothetical protein
VLITALARKAWRLLESAGGFTLDPVTGEDLRGRPAYAVNLTGTEAVFSAIALEEVATAAATVRALACGVSDVRFGGWRCPERGVVVLAAVRLFPRLGDARAFGASTGQRFCFHLGRGGLVSTAREQGLAAPE